MGYVNVICASIEYEIYFCKHNYLFGRCGGALRFVWNWFYEFINRLIYAARFWVLNNRSNGSIVCICSVGKSCYIYLEQRKHPLKATHAYLDNLRTFRRRFHKLGGKLNSLHDGASLNFQHHSCVIATLYNTHSCECGCLTAWIASRV